MPLKGGDNTRNAYYFIDGTDPRTYLTSDSTMFQSIVFRSPEFDLTQIKMFAVCIERTYMYKEDDKLTKGLQVFEFSDIYDIRHIFLRVNDGTYNGGNDPYTYIQKVKSSSHTRREEETTTDDETGESTTTETETTDTNFTHVQVITFDMYFPDEKDPLNMACEAFSNVNMMAFQFKFTNKSGDIYPIDPFETKGIMKEYDENGQAKQPLPGEEPPSKGKIVRMKVRWSQEMGVLADSNWKNNTKVEITARKNDGFVYRLSEFKLCFEGQDGGYNPETGESTGLTEGQKGKTQVQICNG